MSDAVNQRIAELRSAFDRSFAAPQGTEREDKDIFIGIGVADGAYALRLSSVAGLYSDKIISRLPSPLPSLLGVTGIRSGVIPVYGLGAFLGHPIEKNPRWLVLARGKDPVGLAFDGFDGHANVGRADIALANDGDSALPVREVARFGGRNRGVIDVESIVESIRRQVSSAGFDKELTNVDVR